MEKESMTFLDKKTKETGFCVAFLMDEDAKLSDIVLKYRKKPGEEVQEKKPLKADLLYAYEILKKCIQQNQIAIY